ncbi:hypothetical protein NX801_20940 [Streptomyces sp. LP05-1]|uniref:Uncharacterized protein n=1 Tax=Streptomyces pyxinae TaxID=2970734 RepID=A0ABT2CKX8_9ACTN|nr:hypothetical protein [Streptomyces sp. LP05-1]MCS0638076.1 hypothetical protein [Streptomyces sp. LP05-1]
MNTPAPAHPARDHDRTRFWAAACAVLFVPAVVLAGLLTLSSERAGRCLTYGEQCHQALPGSLFTWGAGLAAVAFAAALAAPTPRLRRTALAAQLLFEGLPLLVILSYA